jgi:mRNA-degrading endonuclease YafQ of YafQ-DinJ toxin-antitoxin module
MKVVALLVEELHPDLVQDHPLDAIFRAEPAFGLGPGFDVAQFGLHHPAPVSWRDVADRHHTPETVVIFEHHPGP